MKKTVVAHLHCLIASLIMLTGSGIALSGDDIAPTALYRFENGAGYDVVLDAEFTPDVAYTQRCDNIYGKKISVGGHYDTTRNGESPQQCDHLKKITFLVKDPMYGDQTVTDDGAGASALLTQAGFYESGKVKIRVQRKKAKYVVPGSRALKELLDEARDSTSSAIYEIVYEAL